MKANIVCLDVETGGLKAKENPITQLALQIVDPITFDNLLDYDTFVKPYNNLVITPDALKGSRVTMAQINSGITSVELIKDFIIILKAANKSGKEQTRPLLLGHNIGFDIQFLEYLFTFHNKDLYDYIQRVVFDTIWFSKLYEGNTLKSDENSRFTLTACCERIGIELHGAHGAPADVEATRLLFSKHIKNFRNADSTDSSRNDNAPKSRTRSSRQDFHFEF